MADSAGVSYPEIPGLQIVSEIGRGSFGRVFKAVEPENGRHVAVKLLQGAAVDESALRQFERERRAAGALSVHPNIVTVHRSGIDDAGRPYMVMELAPGRSLADRIRERGRCSPSEVAEIGVKLAGAVETAHRIDLVHCDIKPENVLVGPAGEPLLADFGIARVAHASSSSMGRAGTFAYSAPEVFKGERMSPRSDVFALGATLFTLAAGSSPFMTDPTSSQEAVMYRIVSEDPPDLRALGVPDALASVIERALAKDPAQRYPSAAALGQALQEVQLGAGERPTPLVVEDVSVPEGADAPGTVMFKLGSGTGPLSSSSALGRVRGRRKPVFVGATVLAVVLALVGAVVAAKVIGGDDPPVDADLAAAPKETTTTTQATTTSTTAATTTTVLPAVTHRSKAEEFLGTRIERDWSVPEGQGRIEVVVTITNISAGAFKWHHDEIVPAAMAASPASAKTDPVAEVLADDHVLRWWHELPPGGRQRLTYSIDRQAGWPAAITAAALAKWDDEVAVATAARQTVIMGANNLTDRRAAPGLVPTTTAATAPPSGGNPSGGNPSGGNPGGGTQGGGTQGGRTPTTPAPPPPTTAAPVPQVSIAGPTQICANERSWFTGSSDIGVSGTWSLPNFTLFDPSWTPASPQQWVEPVSGAIGSTFTWTLQVTSAANLTGSASYSFTVVDCNPPLVSIDGELYPCIGYTYYYTGYSDTGVNGWWDLPAFQINDASWTPGAPTQWLIAQQPGTYTWTLTVQSANGQTASASFTFTADYC